MTFERALQLVREAALAEHEVLRPILERWEQIYARYPAAKAKHGLRAPVYATTPAIKMGLLTMYEAWAGYRAARGRAAATRSGSACNRGIARRSVVPRAIPAISWSTWAASAGRRQR